MPNEYILCGSEISASVGKTLLSSIPGVTLFEYKRIVFFPVLIRLIFNKQFVLKDLYSHQFSLDLKFLDKSTKLAAYYSSFWTSKRQHN